MERLLKILLFLAVPAMVLGQIVSIEIKNFKYEVSASEFLIVLATSLFIIYRIVKRDFKFYLPIITLFFVFYLFLAAGSILWASDVSRTIIALRIGIYHLLILVLTLNLIKSKNDLKYLFYFFALAIILISAQLIYQVYHLGGFLTQFILERTSIITPVGPWVTVSAIIVLLIPLVYVLGLNNVLKNKTLSIILFAIVLLAAIASTLTLGKSELIALAAGILFFHYQYFKSSSFNFFSQYRQYFAKILVIIILLFLSASFILAPFMQGFSDRFKQTFNDQNTKFRAREYQLTLSAVEENFFTGVGAGNLKVYFRNNGLCQCYTEASNYLTHFFGELGIIGFLLFVGGGLSIARSLKSFKNLAEKDNLILLGIKTSLVIFLINGFFEATIVGLNYGIVFWVIIGALLAFERMANGGNLVWQPHSRI